MQQGSVIEEGKKECGPHNLRTNLQLFDYGGAQEVSNPTKSLVIANGTTCV